MDSPFQRTFQKEQAKRGSVCSRVKNKVGVPFKMHPVGRGSEWKQLLIRCCQRPQFPHSQAWLCAVATHCGSHLGPVCSQCVGGADGQVHRGAGASAAAHIRPPRPQAQAADSGRPFLRMTNNPHHHLPMPTSVSVTLSCNYLCWSKEDPQRKHHV